VVRENWENVIVESLPAVKLAQFDAVSGHGQVMNDPLAKFLELVWHRLGKDEKISEMLREGTNEVDALVSPIHRETNERLGLLARHQMVAHLKKLRRMGVRLAWNRLAATRQFERGRASTSGTYMGSNG